MADFFFCRLSHKVATEHLQRSHHPCNMYEEVSRDFFVFVQTVVKELNKHQAQPWDKSAAGLKSTASVMRLKCYLGERNQYCCWMEGIGALLSHQHVCRRNAWIQPPGQMKHYLYIFKIELTGQHFSFSASKSRCLFFLFYMAPARLCWAEDRSVADGWPCLSDAMEVH